MSRVTKSAEERRAEIMAAAHRLFVREGFAEVTVSRIVREVGVAQGTFYYHFDSKEAVLDAMIQDYVRDLAARVASIAADGSLDPRRAVETMVRLELGFEADRARELCAIRGADTHTKLFSSALRALAPLYRKVIERGIRARLLKTRHPDLLAETIVLHAHFLFDRDVVGWNDKEYVRRRTIMADLIGHLLILPQGSLDFSVKPKRN